MNHPVFQDNHVVVITGGANGIGLAVAQKLAGFGMRVLMMLNSSVLQQESKGMC